MTHSNFRQTNRGAALLWVLVWLLGMAALIWAAVTVAMPSFTEKRQAIVTHSLAQNDNQVDITIDRFEATLSGVVDSDSSREALLASIGVKSGFLHVNDELVVKATADSTPPDNSADQTQTEQQPVEADELSTEPEKVEDSTPTQLPSISLHIAGEILVVEGQLAESEDPTAFIQQALNIFELDVVSNGLTTSAEVAAADWLPKITDLIVSMRDLREPALNVQQRQITLAGEAPTPQIHDSIISQALASLGKYSLVERISIDSAGQASTSGSSTDTDKVIATLKIGEQAASEAEVAMRSNDAQTNAAEEVQAAAEANPTEEAQAAAEAAEEAQAAADAKAAEEAQAAAEAKAAEEAQAAAKAKAAEEAQAAAEAESNTIANEDKSELQAALQELPSLQILFESNSNVLTQESMTILDSIASVLVAFPDTEVSIEGHTDATGKRAENLELSLNRAIAVRDYLIKQDVSVYNLRARGFGEEVAIANNRTPEGRAINRRIEFKF